MTEKTKEAALVPTEPVEEPPEDRDIQGNLNPTAPDPDRRLRERIVASSGDRWVYTASSGAYKGSTAEFTAEPQANLQTALEGAGFRESGPKAQQHRELRHQSFGAIPEAAGANDAK